MTLFRSALTLLLVLGFTLPTQAAYIGTLDAGSYSTVSWNAPGRFVDRWEFQVAGDSNVAVRFSDIERSIEVFGLTVDLFDNRNLSGLLDGVAFTPGSWFTTTLLAGVDYTLRISGRATGLLGGQYLVEANVAPVPLPAALPMFLLALTGFFGLKLSRRSEVRVA